jgi:hypothetical protein
LDNQTLSPASNPENVSLGKSGDRGQPSPDLLSKPLSPDKAKHGPGSAYPYEFMRSFAKQPDLTQKASVGPIRRRPGDLQTEYSEYTRLCSQARTKEFSIHRANKAAGAAAAGICSVNQVVSQPASCLETVFTQPISAQERQLSS